MNQDSRLVAGLGNPGRDYDWTRHNIGFLALDRLARRVGAGWKLDARFRCQWAKYQDNDMAVGLCKPQTYMNLSGESVGPVSRFYKLPIQSVLIVVDDADLPFGALRMRGQGSSGGHNGLKSIEKSLGSQDYPRLKIGVGRKDQPDKSLVGHVLGKFSESEKDLLDLTLDRAVDQIETWIRSGLVEAMNRFNGPAPK